jgi:hypothetical protein
MLTDMRMNRGLVLCASCVLAVIAVASCSRSEPAAGSGSAAAADAPAAWTVRVEPVQSPAAADSSEPQMTVSDRGVLLSWIERTGRSTNTLKFAERTASGWTAPTIVSSGDNWFVSYADPPVVLRRPDGTLVANWLESTNKFIEGSDLHLTYSKDNGKTWATSFLPHHDGTKGQHAFPSFFEMPGNMLGLVWLDARAQAANPEDLDASISLRYAAFDPSWKQTADAQVDPRVCECCSTTTAVTSEGVIVAFRDRSEKEIRDIAVSRLENGKWTEGTPVHNDNWEIEACPVNGPMLSARGRQAVAAWFTVKNDQGQAWAAFSSDSGHTWGAPIRLDDAGSLGRVDVDLLDDGSAAATWVEFADKRGQFRMRRIEPSGMRSAAVSVAGVSGSSASGVPRMARRGDELVFAWTESTTSDPNQTDRALAVKTAVARLPVMR